MEEIRVVFFGTPVFAKGILQTLLDEKYNVVGVVSQPDKEVGRKRVIVPTPVHELAEQHGIVCIQPYKLRDDYDEILNLKPDLIVTCAYGQIVPEVILKAPKYGCINVHPSLLPKYRGGAPIQRAIINGDRETGVCIMEMVKAMDAGKIFSCEKTELYPDETCSELFDRLEVISCRLLREMLPHYLNGELAGTEQDSEKVVLAPNISKEEEYVSFRNEYVDALYDHIRGLIVDPAPYGMINGKRLKIYKARKTITDGNEVPGKILGFHDHAMDVACNGGIIHIFEMQLEGKSRMNADAFSNGSGRALIGEIFE